MHLKNLSLLNFKNYESLELSFAQGVNCLVGTNGIGKTNVLDAIHYLALTKSYFNPIDKQMIRHDQRLMMVKGQFIIDDASETISVALREGQKKQVKRNRKVYDKIAHHIGLIPVVMITPFDSFLILEGSEMRRKFMDGIIAQEDRNYLQLLMDYNRVLVQRNQLLKHFALSRSFDAIALEGWTKSLVDFGVQLFDKRTAFVNRFLPAFNVFYEQIGGGSEAVSITYQSSLKEKDYALQLDETLSEDLKKQYTTRGIHKDDLSFEIENYPIKKFGSQGQQKTFLLALKLAQFRHMKELMQRTPILLLDDIYDKLDSTRMKRLMGLVSSEGFRQVFITDTHPHRVEELLTSNGIDVQVFNVNNF